ncbi:hypothetical protein L1987_01447 [Smallanthus sonchifolius]|uniref:Uncharacterized protein n=1 Tax=Smallanthus sonchifolius TaxID=185202 RepID=A0ACB9K595_9ASTR|nr:hypothetical protein L1987_01447 [Smallanthus sonchifolius]
MFSILRLLGTRSLPWLIQTILDHISTKREVDTTQFMQVATWLGLIPATSATVSSNHVNLAPFYTMSKQAEVADLLYKANLTNGIVLEYAFAFRSVALDKYCTKWSAAPKTGFIDITTSKDFYRIFSDLQIVSDHH